MYMLYFRRKDHNRLDGEYVLFADSFPRNPKARVWRDWIKPGFELAAAVCLDSGRWALGNSGMLPDHQPLVKED